LTNESLGRAPEKRCHFASARNRDSGIIPIMLVMLWSTGHKCSKKPSGLHKAEPSSISGFLESLRRFMHDKAAEGRPRCPSGQRSMVLGEADR
jgi:hypothetical protein